MGRRRESPPDNTPEAVQKYVERLGHKTEAEFLYRRLGHRLLLAHEPDSPAAAMHARIQRADRARRRSFACVSLSIWPIGADTLSSMADQDRHVLAASLAHDEAVNEPTVIDEDELAKARLDERWREFCLNAEQYVAETTRPAPRVEQPA